LRVDPHQLYETHGEILGPVVDFMRQHARPPKAKELDARTLEPLEACLGGLGRAVRLIFEVTDSRYWTELRGRRVDELLVYLALSRFSGRPRLSELDTIIATDVRAFFGSYRHACAGADRLLAICRQQPQHSLQARSSCIGKQTPSALYVHRDALYEIPPVLQVYEGCARVLAGTIAGANMVKLLVGEPQVSFLSYPTFDTVAHPALHWSFTVNLRQRTTTFRDYRSSVNPPLLHRKEEFLGPCDARRSRFASLTRSEVRAGLYRAPSFIGTSDGWEATLAAAGYVIKGHRLRRRQH
jgi:DNA phosphorothioation-associated putative methyltransferase